MTTLALYAASALLRATVPTDPQYGPEATGAPGQDPGAAAVAPGGEEASPMTWERGDATDPAPARVQARRPRPADGAATARALAAPPESAGAESIDPLLFQQRTWTGP
ncbi:hypothetical protein [Anaeromyxobacter diazotrophicus]|uniref:Uncharacterized protein n=1 Tax=Anaeromyxobacter diazotrophicus TaxID=2590199 RepID=A0A7I9VHB3_9BACT|nr:hypothetical protein [Anaeromyxobacter diazotrophicus]GEJ55774.1 hypothetical protein AMYX_05150 [Anaeromyxobacter diazotrophicus]